MCCRYVRAVFEENGDFKVVERVCRILVDLIRGAKVLVQVASCFRLLGLLRLPCIKNKELLGEIFDTAVGHLGVYVYIDKCIYVILAKLNLKASEAIKHLKKKICIHTCQLLKHLFDKFKMPGFLTNKDLIQVYMYFTKILVALGKDLAISGCWLDLLQQQTFVKTMVFSLLICENEVDNQKAFSDTNKRYINLVKSRDLMMKSINLHDFELSDYDQLKDWSIIMKIDSHADSYLKEEDSLNCGSLLYLST